MSTATSNQTTTLPIQVDDRRLADLEKVVRGHLAFDAAGDALAVIRDDRLYRQHFDSFEEYVEARLEISRAHAYRLIDSAALVNAVRRLSPNGDIEPPRRESQARPLLKIAEEHRAKVWADVLRYHRAEADRLDRDGSTKTLTAQRIQILIDSFASDEAEVYGHRDEEPYRSIREAGAVEQSTASTPTDCVRQLRAAVDSQYKRWPKQHLDVLSEELRNAAGLVDEADDDRKPAKDNYRTRGTGEVEWYTPPEIIALAKEVMGDIDCDPASCELAQQTVFAYRYFDKAENGLAQEWYGRVWLNPPYCQPDIQQFVEKLLGELQAGRTSTALLLTNNATDTAWWQSAAKRCDAICLTAGRIKFHTPSGVAGHPLQGQSLFYFGTDAETFGRVFSSVGLIVSPRAVACLQEAAA